MTMRQIPASGYKLISGKRNPPANGRKYWVQLATDTPGMGWCDMHGPWPVETTVWKWKGDKPRAWEVVAVREAK